MVAKKGPAAGPSVGPAAAALLAALRPRVKDSGMKRKQARPRPWTALGTGRSTSLTAGKSGRGTFRTPLEEGACDELACPELAEGSS